MKKKILIASGIATSLIAAATTVSGILLSNKLMFLKPKNINDVFEREKNAKRYDETWFSECPKTDLLVNSPNGYLIKGTFFKPIITTSTVIICHGVTENKINSMKYIRMYERLGYNVVVYDHRMHGESGGDSISYGHYEKLDLQAIIEEVRKIIGLDAILGIHGESMGAATTLLYAGTIGDNADFYISDCSFSDFRVLLRKILKEKIPFRLELAIALSNLAIRLREGYNFNDVTPILAVENIQKPVLFIHSIPDAFTPSEMTEHLYAAKKNGPKMLALFEKGEHAQSFNASPEEYELTVKNFIGQYVRKNPLPLNGDTQFQTLNISNLTI